MYVLQAVGTKLIKIGSAYRVRKRIAGLAAVNAVPLRLLCVLPGGLKEELRLHKRFAHVRRHSEWFSSTPEILRLAEGRDVIWLPTDEGMAKLRAARATAAAAALAEMAEGRRLREERFARRVAHEIAIEAAS